MIDETHSHFQMTLILQNHLEICDISEQLTSLKRFYKVCYLRGHFTHK